MTRSSKAPPSYFIVPDEKINYDESVQLGNVIYSVTKPDVVLSKPRLADASQPLGSTVPAPKVLPDYTISKEDEKETKIGFFAKILEILGLGLNTSRKNAAATSESYTITSLAISTFEPSSKFMEAVKEDGDVNDVLHNSQEQSAFLITGVAVATGVKFSSSDTKENEKEGSLGVSSHGISVGPSGSRKRKTVLKLSYTDDGPVTLAFKVRKLQLREDGTLSAEEYTDGAYFEETEKKYVVDDDAELNEADVGGLVRTTVVDDFTGEECSLYTSGKTPIPVLKSTAERQLA